MVFVAYLPPDLSVGAADQLIECVASEIAAVKISIKDPIIVVCGDFNGKPTQEVFEQIVTGPTRGNSTLDLVFSNICQYVTRAEVIPPLETEKGILNDHNCAKVHARIPQPKTSLGSEERQGKGRTRLMGDLPTC